VHFLADAPRMLTWQAMQGDGEDHNVYLHDLESGDLVMAARGHHQVLLSSDERLLFTAANPRPGRDGPSRIWVNDLHRLEPLGYIDGHQNYLRPLVFPPDARHLVSLCNSDLLQVHRMEPEP